MHVKKKAYLCDSTQKGDGCKKGMVKKGLRKRSDQRGTWVVLSSIKANTTRKC